MTPREKALIDVTVRAAMLRAADIVDHFTDADVLDAQTAGLSTGRTLQQVSRIDRATLAAAYLRKCAKGKKTTAVQVVQPGVES